MERMYDAIIVGGGPAGLSSAIYLGRAGYRVLVIEKEQFGGQITITREVVNYPGVYETSGSELTGEMYKQAEKFGAEFLKAEVTEIDTTKVIRTVVTSKGAFTCYGIVLALGARPRRIGFDGEERFKGHGVAYCATCDGEFFTGLEVIVIGGGFAAAEEGIFLTRYARKVTILVREEEFQCAASIVEEVQKNPKIKVMYETEIVSLQGENQIEKAVLKNNATGESFEFQPEEKDTFGVFVFVGYEPATNLVKEIVTLNEQGYIVTDENGCTNIPGIYGAGDVCIKKLRQVVTAVSDGAKVATELEKYITHQHKENGVIPKRPVKENGEVKVEQKSNNVSNDSERRFFTDDICKQLSPVFARMQQKLTLKVSLDESVASRDLKQFMNELIMVTDKVQVLYEAVRTEKYLPVTRVYTIQGEDCRIAFHGVPSGHEFNSFIIGLYNASGPGQTIGEAVKSKIVAISNPVSMKILVSLGCTMCPELVMAAQKIACENERITAEMYDLSLYPALKEQYKIMSVPCVIVNDTQVTFGKKGIEELLTWLEQNKM